MKKYFKPIPKAFKTNAPASQGVVSPVSTVASQSVISPLSTVINAEPQALEWDSTRHKKRGRTDCSQAKLPNKRFKSDAAEAAFAVDISPQPAGLEPAASHNGHASVAELLQGPQSKHIPQQSVWQTFEKPNAFDVLLRHSKSQPGSKHGDIALSCSDTVEEKEAIRSQRVCLLLLV